MGQLKFTYQAGRSTSSLMQSPKAYRAGIESPQRAAGGALRQSDEGLNKGRRAV